MAKAARRAGTGALGVRGNLGTARQAAWSSLASLNSPGEGVDGFKRRAVEVAALKEGLKAVTPGATVSHCFVLLLACRVRPRNPSHRSQVNDAVLAAVAGAIGDLTPADHADGRVSTVTATVPVNLRPLLALLSGQIPAADAPIATQVRVPPLWSIECSGVASFANCHRRCPVPRSKAFRATR